MSDSLRKMRYSVVNRFRGALAGALIGGNLAFGSGKSPQNYQNLEYLIRSAESLIQLGRFDLEDWQQRQTEKVSDLNLQEIDILFATLPITLFFHEDINKLRQILLSLVKVEDEESILQDAILALSYAIAQILTEKFHPSTIIPQTISFLQQTTGVISQNLLKVEQMLRESPGLATVEAQLSNKGQLSQVISMAFYCFVSTPEDFRLSVLRVNQVDCCSEHLSAITGILSGVHNSIIGIPVTLQVNAQNSSVRPELRNFSLMLELADALAAVWSGMYDLLPQTYELSQDRFAIAAPRIIR